MPTTSKPHLHIDWATHKAAEYACRSWHYSGSLPGGGRLQFGAWEDGRFVGVIVYGIGSGNATNGTRYSLRRSHEMAELARVALRDHATPVSRIVAITLKMLKRKCPGLRLVLSMADPYQGHHGGIYQAGNWVYTGQSENARFFRVNGKLTHPRTIGSRGLPQTIKGARRLDRNAEAVIVPGKHRYLMPLDDDMRAKIAPLAKPYPMRGKQATSEHPSDSGGATPTPALQTSP